MLFGVCRGLLMEAERDRVLVAGATGFVGSYLWPALQHEGFSVTGLTRDSGRALRRWPDRRWAEGDVADEARMAEVLRGCRFAYYLVHGMGEGVGNFRCREIDAARRFSR